MNCQALADELAKEEYKGLDDQAAADVLNARAVVTVRNVPTQEIATWAAENGVMTGLYMVSLSPDSPAQLKAVVQTLLTVLERLSEWRIMEDASKPTPAATQMMGALMQAGVLSDEQAAELMAMAVTLISRATQLGLGTVTAGDVQSARAGGV